MKLTHAAVRRAAASHQSRVGEGRSGGCCRGADNTSRSVRALLCSFTIYFTRRDRICTENCYFYLSLTIGNVSTRFFFFFIINFHALSILLGLVFRYLFIYFVNLLVPLCKMLHCSLKSWISKSTNWLQNVLWVENIQNVLIVSKEKYVLCSLMEQLSCWIITL